MNIQELNWCGTVPSQETVDRARKIKLLLLDVDGVQTDGTAYYLPNSNGTLFETKGFHSHDGLAFHMLARAGIKYGAISGRKSGAVEERAQSMGFSYLYEGHLDKVPILQEIQIKSGLSPEAIAYVGDDFADIPILNRVGLACAVANARAEVKAIAHFVTKTDGGHGAVREVTELVLKAQEKWETLLAQYALAK